jgi:hypothetical protein
MSGRCDVDTICVPSAYLTRPLSAKEFGLREIILKMMNGVCGVVCRASVLMALDSAGVSMDEVLRDARVRQEAIDSCEAEQRKLFEAHWAQKEEENASDSGRIRADESQLPGAHQAQPRWRRRRESHVPELVTAKQRESQSMAEAAKLRAKPVTSAPPME